MDVGVSHQWDGRGTQWAHMYWGVVHGMDGIGTGGLGVGCHVASCPCCPCDGGGMVVGTDGRGSALGIAPIG